MFPMTRTSLIVRLGSAARSARERAWNEFFGIYSPLIYRMARHAGLGETDAEEVVATVMRNFASSVRTGFDLETRFRQYLRTITNRQIRREKGGRRVIVLSELRLPDAVADGESQPDRQWDQFEREERWRTCLERLKSSPAVRPRDWTAFESWVLRGEPAKTVARRYGITPNRLHGIKHKLVNELRKLKIKLDVELGEV
ncbi:MAG: sigma-70 family RNA polymerase sigma factor [Phycisphaerae bacterium]